MDPRSRPQSGWISLKKSGEPDPSVWYRPVVKPNIFDYYEYILCYINDILYISHNPGIALVRIQAFFKFKGDKIEQIEIHLGAQVGKIIVDGAEGWCMSADKYVRDAVDNVEQNLAKSNQLLPNRCKKPIMSGYRTENDTSSESQCVWTLYG